MYYTTIEQSKKLLELGLDAKSADMCYKTVDVDNAESDEDCTFDLVCRPYTDYLKYVIPMGLTYKAIPCWSLEALFELIPSAKAYKIEGHHSNGWKCATRDSEGSLCRFKRSTIMDAVFATVVWLLETNYIKE